MTLAFDAMTFAMRAHGPQQRKYVGGPYWVHLAEVAGIVATAAPHHGKVPREVIISTAWLHDTVEDCGIDLTVIECEFGAMVATGVELLTKDRSDDSRIVRAAKDRARLSTAAGWVQNVKVADIISNTASVAERASKEFATLYLGEKAVMLRVLTKAEPGLLALAHRQIEWEQSALAVASPGRLGTLSDG